MRFAIILLLATAAQAIRLTQTDKKQDMAGEIADQIISKCDGLNEDGATDGVLQKGEAVKGFTMWIQGQWKAANTDGNKVVTGAEIAASLQAQTGMNADTAKVEAAFIMSLMDTDKNGAVEFKEAKMAAKKLAAAQWEQADVNDDDAVDKEELRSAMKQYIADFQARHAAAAAEE